MTQVETVALWAGLISSVAGIVLSVVAMVFAIWVNNRASEINDQMIRSLQKIESSVERVSSDTRELITAGWNKMLSGIGNEADGDQTGESQTAISHGLAAEVRSELLEGPTPALGDPARIEQLERALEELQENVAAQLTDRSLSRRAGSIDYLLERINRLPLEARAVFGILASGRHLDKKTYKAAMSDPILREALRSLRKAGLLVPLEGFDLDGEPAPVYHLPPGLGKKARVASQLAGDVPEEIRSTVHSALVKSGYKAL